MPRSSSNSFLRTWGPAIVMLACIAVESTTLFSAQHTQGWIYFFLRKAFPGASSSKLWEINLILRKTGHVIGYALLGLSLYRGFHGALGTASAAPANNSDTDPWQFRFAALAIVGTFLVATADEVHQMYLPGRTGTWWDVLLDTSAAAVAQVILYLYLRRRTPPPASTAASTVPANS